MLGGGGGGAGNGGGGRKGETLFARMDTIILNPLKDVITSPTSHRTVSNALIPPKPIAKTKCVAIVLTVVQWYSGQHIRHQVHNKPVYRQAISRQIHIIRILKHSLVLA